MFWLDCHKLLYFYTGLLLLSIAWSKYSTTSINYRSWMVSFHYEWDKNLLPFATSPIEIPQFYMPLPLKTYQSGLRIWYKHGHFPLHVAMVYLFHAASLETQCTHCRYWGSSHNVKCRNTFSAVCSGVHIIHYLLHIILAPPCIFVLHLTAPHRTHTTPYYHRNISFIGH